MNQRPAVLLHLPDYLGIILMALTIIIGLVGCLSLGLVSIWKDTGGTLNLILPVAPKALSYLLPTMAISGVLCILFALLRWRGTQADPLILPLVGLLFTLGLLLITRLNGLEGAWQQIVRGFLPGSMLIAFCITWPPLIEYLRRFALPISLAGLALPIATAVFGPLGESGARLALKIGALPPVQTSELLKVALLVFLAWYIEREGRQAEGRAQAVLGVLRLPPLRYFLPGLLFVGMATLALVRMSDFGAVLILGMLFITMLYAGFETRTFATVAAAGLLIALLVGVVLYFNWQPPQVIQQRFLAWSNPWSTAPLPGGPAGVTIASGPGYQIQHALYAVVAGGVTGTGLGQGYPQFIPLAVSDLIFAALVEELGLAIGLAVLACFVLLTLRILRIAMLLPEGQVFEHLLLIGIAVHLFTQVFVMVGGTLNLLPLTGVTIPFLSLGGSALTVNLGEIGLVLSLASRLHFLPPHWLTTPSIPSLPQDKNRDQL